MAGIAKGTVFGGRYIVQSQVGAGGMATVYRGVDNVLDRPVAIKVMLSQYATDPAFAQRFKQEAQAAAALQNPYIVQVYDWGRDEATGTYYIVMEYLRGTDLKTGIRSHGALAPRKVAQIGAQVCSALSVAHAHDIIHRDIKPQNIMIQPNGDAKVMDFGIARAKNSHLTQTNSVLGTAHYVSPEQAQGKELGPTSDLYSLGVVMYEAATGKLPFDGEDAVSVALKQVNQQPVSPSIVNPNIDDNLEAIILRCMAKDPRQRYQSADELRHALNNYINGRPIGTAAGAGAYAAATSRMPGSQAATQVMRGADNGYAATQRLPQTQNAVAPQRMGQPNYVGRTRGAYGGAGTTDPHGRAAGRANNNMVIVITLLVAILIIALAILGITQCVSCTPSTGQQGNRPGSVVIKNPATVPNIVNRTEAEASSMLKAQNLELDVQVTYMVSTTVAKGKIISQDPVEGTQVEKGSTVKVVVSSGTDAIFIPSIVGKTETEALRLLQEAGLTGVHDPSLDGHHATIPFGSVLTTDPVNQRVAKGTTIRYGFSTGPDPDTLKVSVPDLYTVPYPLDQALRQLEAVKLKSEVIEEYNPDVEKGHVIKTEPAAGRQVEKGTTVKIYLSKGGEPTAIPAYTDPGTGLPSWSSAAYQSALVNAGFEPEVIEGDPAPDATLSGMVYKTDPVAGSEAAQGSTVKMYVYAAFKPTVPDNIADIVGYSIDGAYTYLRTLGFTNVQVVNVVNGSPVSNWSGWTFSHVSPKGQQAADAAIYVFAVEPAPTPTACPSCGQTEGHAETCPSYVCPECGGAAGAHNPGCSKYVPPAPVACPSCGQTSGHATTCPSYVCPECGGAAGSHNPGCSQYVAPACPSCGQTSGHAETCPSYVCPECGGATGSHYDFCSKYVAPPPPPPVGCAECGLLEGHAETCSQYVAVIPDPVTE